MVSFYGSRGPCPHMVMVMVTYGVEEKSLMVDEDDAKPWLILRVRGVR